MKKPLAAIGAATLVSLCGAAHGKPTANQPGFCKALDQFASASPRDADRSALFFWPAPSEEIDMYAPMQAQPMDGPAHRLYEIYGQWTHYVPLYDLKARLDLCASAKSGLVLIELSPAACDGHESIEPCLSIRKPARR